MDKGPNHQRRAMAIIAEDYWHVSKQEGHGGSTST